MSHLVSIKTEVRDLLAIRSTCRRLQLREPYEDTVQLFGEPATGVVVDLPDWRYPIVCEIGTGKIRYDNFQGRWGSETQLHRFLQFYAVEKAALEARREGHSVQESVLSDGSIRLQIAVS